MLPQQCFLPAQAFPAMSPTATTSGFAVIGPRHITVTQLYCSLVKAVGVDTEMNMVVILQ